MFRAADFFQNYKESFLLELCAGEGGLNRRIRVAELERPGLSLTGFLKGHSPKRILVFGKIEMEYLRTLTPHVRRRRLHAIVSEDLPFIVVARGLKPFKEMIEIAENREVALFRSQLLTSDCVNKLTVLLSEWFAPQTSLHGTFVETFGIGVLIQGDSSVGKSETALGLIERGHRLISDDVVIIKKKEASYLEGSGVELTRHLLEIRGIGIINVAHIHGAVCVREKARIDLIVRLEEWDDTHFYDRVGLEEKFLDVLGVKVPHYLIPVKPGRDVVLLLETIVLNHRLRKMGYHSAKEFNRKLLERIASKQPDNVLN